VLDLAESQPGGLDIITLNYDLTIERAAANRELRVVRGVEEWQAGAGFAFDPVDRTINLVKPHGSIDWVIETVTTPGGLPQRVTRLAEHPLNRGSDPAVVIGQREKLETEGSTLGLMRAFDDVLHRTDRLVIVGYSGGDGHVNTLIRDWINADLSRTIVAVDPSWPRQTGFLLEGFKFDLNRYLGAPSGSSRTRRLVVVKESAAKGLPKALSMAIDPDPEPWFHVDGVVSENIVTVRVTNRGRDLDGVRIAAESTMVPSPVPLPTMVRIPPPTSGEAEELTSSVGVHKMESGEEVTVLLTFPSVAYAHDWSIRVSADREIDRVDEFFNAGGKIELRGLYKR
jgi:hypothetical protein